MARAAFRGYNRVKFQSSKIGKTVFCQSIILRDFLIHLEWAENVLSYKLNPFKILTKISGKRKTINPQVLVKYSDQPPAIVWLKSLETEEQRQLAKSVKTFCKTKGFNFVVTNAQEIRKNPLLSNLKLLRRYLPVYISLNHSILCKEFFTERTTANLGDLINFLIIKGEDTETAYALISHKIIELDIYSTHINFDSPINLKNEFPKFQNRRLVV